VAVLFIAPLIALDPFAHRLTIERAWKEAHGFRVAPDFEKIVQVILRDLAQAQPFGFQNYPAHHRLLNMSV
jgi:hypothetical protein